MKRIILVLLAALSCGPAFSQAAPNPDPLEGQTGYAFVTYDTTTLARGATAGVAYFDIHGQQTQVQYLAMSLFLDYVRTQGWRIEMLTENSTVNRFHYILAKDAKGSKVSG